MGKVAGVRRRLVSPVAALLVVGGGISAASVAWFAAPTGASSITINSEPAFRAAWDSNLNDTIVLGQDIHLSVGTCNSADRTSVSDKITIDGQGLYKIVQDCPGERVLYTTPAAT